MTVMDHSSYEDHAGYERIRSWLGERCGISYPEHKADLLRQRLARVTRSFKLEDLNELAGAISKGGRQDVELAVMHAASTNHTFFFREPEVLEVFSKNILPQLADREQIRIWSAAASTGDEAYTIAMLVAEHLGAHALKKLAILGTDISAPVVERAELGVFSGRQLSQMDRTIKKRYMTPTGIEQYRVNESLRNTCTFRRLNLKATPYPFAKQFQVVFCRNILYYFEPEDQAATLRAIYDATEPGGFLVTSVTEAVRDLCSDWIPVTTGIYRRA
ncbi:CheR family methyltransferase [Thalassobius sp. MITS945101]|uniref:CheR family methyltransferase n=1 Tax=Thalassobius sp. MITS945101 TaxID=3096994 RepID=UPI00399A6CA9